ncbi:MAG: hypothetical protein NZT92_10105, partial [Abditibacteriales bacterium]|nr:hypothetical protein [Abditibacteriales bacterium]
ALHHRDDLVVAVKKRVYDPLGLRWKEQDDRAALAKIPDPACGLVTARTRIPHRVLRESRDTGRGVSDILGERKHR